MTIGGLYFGIRSKVKVIVKIKICYLMEHFDLSC